MSVEEMFTHGVVPSYLDRFPRDIAITAKTLSDALFDCGSDTDAEVAAAKAILAERQRCADIVGSYGTTPDQPDGKTGAFRKHRHLIRSAILGTT